MQSDVLGFVNHTHTAAAQLFNDAIVRDSLADHSLPIMERTFRCNVRSATGASQRSYRQTRQRSWHRSVGCIEITVRLARLRLLLSETGVQLADQLRVVRKGAPQNLGLLLRRRPILLLDRFRQSRPLQMSVRKACAVENVLAPRPA